MSFPDQSHVNRLRDALWRWPEGGAVIMVGAGFSRNAKKAGPHSREMPVWWQTTEALARELYPDGEDDRRTAIIKEASSTSGFLRLAQEYEAAFGKPKLHEFIRRFVPDDEYIPGEVHRRLMQLPWRDVFTTNWDTLLERTRLNVADRRYSVVRTMDGLHAAARPRIVKLHGSFPDYFPFIFTEDDFRTYPQDFAPFVNTVQQSMMENVVCMIGFSGDDPNFLLWSGWVRDNLGESAPKIYLAGWLNLSPHRRRMLEKRNVVPIDIARHPKASDWHEPLRHRYATDWFLHSLEEGQPYELTKWPICNKKSPDSIPVFLQPELPSVFRLPRVWLSAPV